MVIEIFLIAITHLWQQQQNKSNSGSFSKLLKSKCASTTNLLNDSGSLCHGTLQQKAHLGAKSVNFLAFSRLSESSDSLGNEEEEEEEGEEEASSSSTSENYENQFEIVVGNSSKMARLESDLSEKSNEISALRCKLQQTIEGNSDAEKKVYEQKLADMRSHFNQQLSMFEENERQLMQDRINSLQDMYNDLKVNYQRSLENEVRGVRHKLSESQSYASRLIKELSKCKCQDSARVSFFMSHSSLDVLI